jgi:hypothetical protein
MFEFCADEMATRGYRAVDGVKEDRWVVNEGYPFQYWAFLPLR